MLITLDVEGNQSRIEEARRRLWGKKLSLEIIVENIYIYIYIYMRMIRVQDTYLI